MAFRAAGLELGDGLLDRLAAGVVRHGQACAPFREHASQRRAHPAAARDQHDLASKRTLRGHGRFSPSGQSPFQGMSATFARWFTARARTNRRSPSRLR